jgi:hypothetical protein
MPSRSASFLGALLAALCTAGLATGSKGSGKFLAPEEALRLAYPGAELERHTAYLTGEQKVRIEAACKGDLERSTVPFYTLHRDGKLLATAYLDTHIVRTKRETLMVVVGSDDNVSRLELIAFGEPREYIPRDSFYEQFPGRPLDELSLKRGIRGVTGATLTVRATTEAARRALATHAELKP